MTGDVVAGPFQWAEIDNIRSIKPFIHLTIVALILALLLQFIFYPIIESYVFLDYH